MTTTEVATVPFLAGTSISHSKKMLQETFADLDKVDGFQSFHLGTSFESPEDLQILVDWDSREHHEAFAASADYKPWLERLDKAIDTSKAAFHHVNFQPVSELSKAAGAPVTEITTIFFGGGASPDAEWLDDAARAAELVGEGDSASSSGFVGLAYGITHEEISSREGDKGKAGVVMVGWKSEEARAAFRETQTFQEVFGLLKGEAKAIEVLPVTFGQGVD